MKRKLTKDEIEDMTSIVKIYNTLPTELNNSSIDKIKNHLISKLSDIEIYPEMIDKLKDNIRKEYHKSIVSAGESVGVIVGQSLGKLCPSDI